MGGTGIRRRPAARAWSIALTIGRITEKRSSLDYALWRIRISGIPAFTRPASVPADVPARGLRESVKTVPIAAPLPDVSGHVVEAIAVGWKRLHRRGPDKSIFRGVVFRKSIRTAA